MSGMITLGVLNQQLSTRMTEVSRAAAQAAQETAEGKPADIGAAQPARFGQLIDRQADLSRVNAYQANAEAFIRRADVKQTALGEIAAAAEELLVAATSQLPLDPGATEAPASYSAPVFAQAAQSALERVLTAFNATDGTGFVFSGVDADRAALAGLDQVGPSGLTPQQAIDAQVAANPPADPAGALALVAALDTVFDAGATPANPAEDFAGAFYNGAPATGPRVTVSVDEAVTLDFGLQADDPAARDLLQGLHMLASVDLAGMDPEALSAYAREAVDRLAQGLDAVRVAQAELGAAQSQAQSSRDALEARGLLITGEINAVESVDPYEAQLRYTRLETQLNLMFEIVARAGRLNLFQYLR